MATQPDHGKGQVRRRLTGRGGWELIR